MLDAYRSPTSDAATVALPLAALTEEDGTLTSLEGRVQRLQKTTAPPGLGRPGWEVLSELLTALGLETRYRSASEVFAEVRRVIPEYGALSLEAMESVGGAIVPFLGISDPKHAPGSQVEVGGTGKDTSGTHWLALEGSFDWSEDLLVQISPTLRRDGAAQRKLYPKGLVTMNPSDGQALGVRAGWSVRIRSAVGEVLVPVAFSPRVEAGVLLAPFIFRDALAAVLGDGTVQRVEVERT